MHLPLYLFYTICSGTSQTQSGLFNVIQILVHISYLQFLTDHHTEAKEIRTFPFYRTVVVQLLLHITLILMLFQSLTVMFRACG